MLNPSKYQGNELKYIEQVLNSEQWSATGGSWNNALEQAFCEKFGVKYGIAMNSGTATLHCALKAAGVDFRHEVISPALTVIMDAAATIHAGARPVYVDVDPYTFNIDPKDVEWKITRRTKAIIAVGLYGLSPDMDAIMAIADKHGLVVIEDNAQCYLPNVSMKGHFASYSFENTKHISCGEGGILLTNNEKYAEKARKIAGHGFKNLTAKEGRVRLNQDVFQSPDYKRHDVIGYNYRMPEFNAAIALAQLEKLDDLIAMRLGSAMYFREVMARCDYLMPQFIPEGYDHSYYTFAAVYQGDTSVGVSWQDFRRAYIDNGGDGIYGAWSVPYLEPAMKRRRHAECCPVAETLQPQIMQFKTNYRSMELAEQKADALLKTIEGFR